MLANLLSAVFLQLQQNGSGNRAPSRWRIAGIQKGSFPRSRDGYLGSQQSLSMIYRNNCSGLLSQAKDVAHRPLKPSIKRLRLLLAVVGLLVFHICSASKDKYQTTNSIDMPAQLQTYIKSQSIISKTVYLRLFTSPFSNRMSHQVVFFNLHPRENHL
jgi:hypothetical protein